MLSIIQQSVSFDFYLKNVKKKCLSKINLISYLYSYQNLNIQQLELNFGFVLLFMIAEVLYDIVNTFGVHLDIL